LKLHPGKTRLTGTNMGMNFLGFRILPDRLRVLNDNLGKGRRRLRELTDDYAEGKVSKEKIKQLCAKLVCSSSNSFSAMALSSHTQISP
jgi:RNA-directed DNA polymerase